MELKLFNKITKELDKKYENFSLYLQNPTQDFKYSIEHENYLDFDFENIERILGVKLRYYQKLAIYFSNYYLQNINKLTKINSSINQLAYWKATGSGKTIIMKADILNYLNYLKQNGKINGNSQVEIIITSSLSDLIEQLKTEFENFINNISKEINVKTSVTIQTIQSLMNKKEYKTQLLPNQYRIVLADEAHIGLTTKESAFKEFKDTLVENKNQSFMFEYSATFYNVSEELKQEYEEKIIFEYGYDKFYNDFYGKDFKFGVIKGDTLDDENIDENIKQNLDDFEKKLTAYEEYMLFEDRPLLIVVGNKVSGKGKNKKEKQEAQNEISDVKNFISYLIKIKDISKYKRIFNTNTKNSLYVIYNKLDNEILLAFDENKPFGLVNVGDTSSLITTLKSEKNVEYREINFAKDEWKFKNIDSKKSPINILIGSRKFSAGWNSFRVSQICLINFGVSKGNTIIQIFGRGVRLKGLRGDGKRRMNYVDENSFKTEFKKYSSDFILTKKEFERLKYLETLFIYSLKSTYLKNFIESETTIFKQKIIKEIAIKKNKPIKSLVIKNDFKFEKIDSMKIEHSKVIYTYNNKIKEFPILLTLNLSNDKNIIQIDEYLWDFIDSTQIEKYLANQTFTITIEELKELINNHIIIYYDKKLDIKKFENLIYKVINTLQKYIQKQIEKQQKKHYIKEITYPYDKYNVEIILKRKIDIDLYRNIIFEVIEFIKKANKDTNCNIPKLNTLNVISKITSNEKSIQLQNFEIFEEIEFTSPTPIALNPEKIKKEKKTLLEKIKNSNDNIEKISISPDSLDEWELKFLNDLTNYAKKKRLDIEILRNIPKKGSAIIGKEDFYPDFLIKYQENETTHIIFCDPKGIRDPKNRFKVCIAPYLIKKYQTNNLKFHSFIITHTSQKEINWLPIENLKIEEWFEFFNLLRFDSKSKYIEKIFERIKDDKIELYFKEITQKYPDENLEEILNYFFIIFDKLEYSNKYKLIKEFFEKIESQVNISDFKKKYKLCDKITTKEELVKFFIFKYIFDIDKNEYEKLCQNLSLSSIKNFFKKDLVSEIVLESISIPFVGLIGKFSKAVIEDLKREIKN